jgi:hypothetical protein
MKKLLQPLAALVVFLIVLTPAALHAQTTQQETLDNTSVIKLTKLKFSNDLIKAKISNTPCNFSTNIESLTQLKNAGVSDDIISMMVSKSSVPTSSAGATSLFPKEQWGTLSEDNTRYISKDGKYVFEKGKTITLGNGSDVDHLGGFLYVVTYGGKFGDYIASSQGMAREYAGQKVVIKSIIKKKSNTSDILVKNAPKTVFIIFELSRNNEYKVNIESALLSKELIAAE